MADRKLAALLELERRGKLTPSLQGQLDTYRRQGLAKPLTDAGRGKTTESEEKNSGFYARMLGSDHDYRATGGGIGMQARGMAGAAVAAIAPDALTNSASSSERQNAEQAQKDFISASLRYESGAAISPSEFENQRRIFFPEVGDRPDVIAQKARARDRAVASMKLSAGSLASEAEKASGISLIATPPPAAAGGIEISKDGSATYSTERDKAFAIKAQALFDRGGQRADFDKLALQYAAPAYGNDLNEAISYRDRGGKGATIVPSQTGSKGPSVLGAMAATPAGSAIAGVGNAVTSGYLDEIVGATGGDQQQAQLAKDVMREAHPYAFGGGEIAGGIGMSLGAGGLAARALPAAAGVFLPSLAGDAAYGSAYGSGESNDDRLGGAAVGGVSAIAGSLGGQALVRGVAGAVSPEVSQGVRFLRDNGVRTTPGQSMGETASRVEEKLVSVPVLGDLIRNGRHRALADFNRGYLNNSLRHIGAEIPDGLNGTAAMAHGQQAFDNAYDAARSNMQLMPDAQLATDLTDLSNRVAGGQLSEASSNRLATIYQAEVMRRMGTGNGPILGDAYKTISSRLNTLQRSTRATDPELSGAIGEMQGAIDAAARRSSPPEASAAMDAADQGYALWVRAENAARSRGADTATFTPTQLDAAVQRGDGSIRSRAYLRGDALGQDWADAGKAILRDQVPNSGTADRVAAGSVLAGAGYLHPGALGAGVLASVAYAPGVRDVLSAALTSERPAVAQAVANALRDRAAIGGSIGTASALDSFR